MNHLKTFPSDLSEMLQNAETFEVWFLTRQSTEKFFPFESDYVEFEANRINDHVDDEIKQQLISAFIKDAEKGGELSRCWIPHHGIKATYNNRLIEIAMCYMCSQCRGQISDKTFFIDFPAEDASESKAIFDRIFNKI